MRSIVKKYIKSSNFFKKLVAWIIYIYLRFVYFTTRWEYVFLEGNSAYSWNNMQKTAIVVWHDKLAILPYSFLGLKYKINMLVSPHSDGSIIASVLRMFKFNIIEGSSNKNSLLAVKNILRAFDSNENLALTPDGPRGPRYKINSNIIEIAKRSGANIIPLSCLATNYFNLGSWDKLMFPLPFGKVKVFCGTPIICDANNVINADDLEQILNNLTSQ